MWVDFSGVNHADIPTPSQLQFVADHYAIVSLEKCFAEKQFPGQTEAAVASVAAQLKNISSKGQTAVNVLNYFNSLISFESCYQSGKVMRNTPEWWLKSDTGTPYELNNDPNTKYYDLFNDTVVSWVANNASFSYVSCAASCIDGLFADKGGDHPLPSMNTARASDFETRHHAELAAMRTSVSTAFGGVVIANALGAGTGRTSADNGLEVLPFVDGVCFEHFGAFEMLAPDTGFLDPQYYRDSIALVAAATKQGKIVLICTWPGPVSVPITPLGPSYSKRSSLPTPATREARAAAAKQWLIPTLASYLIVANELTFFSYNWWYGIDDGVVPCADDPTSCSSPPDWLPELLNATGEPLGGYEEKSANVYVRKFKNCVVVFDANWVNASYVRWH